MLRNRSRVAVVLLVSVVGLVGAGFAADEADDDAQADSPAVPAAAQPAMKRYTAAVAAADKERARVVDKARADLVGELKAAQKSSIQRNDVEAATACAELAKRYASSGPKPAPQPSPRTYAGTVWRVDGDRIRFNPDGTITHSNPKYTGHWIVVDARKVAVLFDHGYVDVWTVDAAGKAYKGASFQKGRDYEGTVGR